MANTPNLDLRKIDNKTELFNQTLNYEANFDKVDTHAGTVLAQLGEIENQISPVIVNFTERQNLDANYNYKEYTAFVENKTNVDYTDEVVKIYASFPQGECLSEKCIVVEDSNGNVIPHQWEDDRHVNYQYDRNMGRYIDSSLKDGYILIIDSLTAGSNKVFTVKIYQEEVSTLTSVVSSVDITSQVTLSTSKLILNFDFATKYLGQVIKVNGVQKAFTQDPAYSKISTYATPMQGDADTTVKSYKVNGSGVIYREFELTLTNLLFDFVIKTRMYKNNKVEMKQYFKAKRLIGTTECYATYMRLWFDVGTSYVQKTDTVLRGSWISGADNQSVNVLFVHGDIPRNTSVPARPTYPVMGVMTTGLNDTNKRVVIGWAYAGSTPFEIPQGEVFASGIVVNYGGFTTAANDTVEAFNPLVGRITDKTKIKLKKEISELIAENIYNIETDYVANYDYASEPSIMARLILWKEFGIGDLLTIAEAFRTTTVVKFGQNDAESMWTNYQSGLIVLQRSSRWFPTAQFLLDELTKAGVATETVYLTTLIKSYAEMICRVIEEKGYSPLAYADTIYASNAMSAGLRALSMGLKLEPANTRWLNAFGVGELKLNGFIAVQNIFTDFPAQNISTGHYIHYTAYAFSEYINACKDLNRTPVINASSYPYNTTSAYGAVKEQEFCISSSRRGLGHTVSYIIYLLIQDDNPSSLAQAKRIIERLIEQNKPMGGHEYPLEKWRYEPAMAYKDSAPFESSTLGEVMYYLDDSVVADYALS